MGDQRADDSISIHALRVEGDGKRDNIRPTRQIFLSTPSGWRATRFTSQSVKSYADFYPRPPGGGRLDLREPTAAPEIFLSTPSGWRATSWGGAITIRRGISIHALRVEGDGRLCVITPTAWGISIHALRVEGDGRRNRKRKRWCYFYPRPPGGGRRGDGFVLEQGYNISIHALRVEGD